MTNNKVLDKTIPTEYIPVTGLLLLTLLQLFAHQSHTPAWLSGFVLLVCGLRYLTYRRRQSDIPFLVRSVLVIMSITVFVLYYRTNFSVDMAASFLFLAAVLKLIELKKSKDVHVFIFTMFYLSAVSFLFEQGILQTIIQLLIVSLCFFLLLLIQVTDKSLSFSHLSLLGSHTKSMAKLITIALPLVIILFLFFPRISPLWQMPIKSEKAKTGMSSEMSPGDISELARSSETAFRATLGFDIPERSSLYWRGLVLDHFDGRKWSQSSGAANWVKPQKVDAGRFIATRDPVYQVMLEPNQEKWVFALNGSQPASTNVIRADMGLYRLKAEAIQATRYQMSLPENDRLSVIPAIPTSNVLQNVDRKGRYYGQDLQLPSKRLNPKTQAFIERLKLSFTQSEDLLVYLLNHFREQEFFYTLEPDLLEGEFVDQFMFESRKGFCEHYASSLAYMLRLAGIPARVVMGYQGGELNEQANYMIVHQYDAHAWVEAFLPDYGWFRVDPTAMVSPLRISNGLGGSLGNEDAFLENSPFASAAMKFGMLNWVRLKMDEINFQWQTLVVNYNQDQQDSFITATLGENSLLRIALFFVYLMVLLFLSMLAYLGIKRLSGYSFAEKKYLAWLFILSKFGYRREQGETPRMFLARIQKTRATKLASITHRQTELLERHQYSGNHKSNEAK
ncbi:MAG: transglutaminaseTgpA domain-containing protein [Oleiphilus sp.]